MTPATFDYDPALPSEIQDPFPGWSRARHEAPVFYSERHNVWWVSKYEDIREILADTHTYSSRGALKAPPEPAGLRDILGGLPWEHTITAQDPPDHSRLRKLVQVAFTPKHIAERAGQIRAIANDLIDRFPASGPFDFVASFSQPLPLTVITEMVGAPPEDAPVLRRWTEVFFRLLGSGGAFTEEQRAELFGEMREMIEYCRDFVAERRRNPREDLATRLIFATADDGTPRLNDVELCSIILSLFTAGNETSASMIAQTLHCLLANPRQWTEVRADPSLIPAAVEETLRHTCPVKGIQRTATRPARIGGVDIPAGAQLYLLIGSTGRDERKWPAADVWDLHRGDLSQSLAFGRGIHFCVGAPLARLEGRIAIECLIERVPDIHIAEGEKIIYGEYVRVLSPSRLIVEARLACAVRQARGTRKGILDD